MTGEHMIVNDFNLPGIDWKRANINYSSSLELSLQLFINEFELQQIKTIKCCLPTADLDHTTQLMLFQLSAK